MQTPRDGIDNHLREVRQRSGLSQSRLAARAGLTAVTVWNLENGKSKGQPATWRVLASALGVSVEDLRDRHQAVA